MKKKSKDKRFKKEVFFIPFSVFLKKADEAKRVNGTLKLDGMDFLVSYFGLSDKKNIILEFDNENLSLSPDFYGIFPEIMAFFKNANEKTGCLVKFEENFLDKIKPVLPTESFNNIISTYWNYLANTGQF